MYSISSFGHEHPQLRTFGDGKISSPPSESKEAEISKLEHLIRHSSFTELGRFQPLYPPEAAKLCHELVLDHGDAVTTMLVNEKVSEEALKLLAADGLDAQNDLQKKQRLALAEAVLNARPYLANSGTLPPLVAEVLEKRRVSQRDYWSEKADKHQARKDGLESFLGKGLPFLHKKNDKSATNFNGGVGEMGKMLECRHLSIAIAQAEQPKHFLKAINQRKVGNLKYEELEKTYRDRVREEGKTSVQFSRCNFGKLLATIQALRPSKMHSYAVQFPYTSTGNVGHVMRVFIDRPQKLRQSEACLKVSFYEPGVTGDMTHLNALPEELTVLSIDAFDRASVCQNHDVNVLSMDVEDPELAAALVGKFVTTDVSSQTSSLASALAYGNVREAEAAASKLAELLRNEESSTWPGSQVTELCRSLHRATQNGHADVIKVLGGFLESIKSQLAPQDIKEVLLTKRSDGIPVLFMAMQNGHADAIKAFGGLLESIKYQLTSEDLKDILLAKRTDGVTGLFMALQYGRAEAVEAYGGLLESFKDQLTPEDLKNILLAQSSDGEPGLFRLLQQRNTSAITVYARLIIAIQSDARTRLPRKEAMALLKSIRAEQGSRPFWAFGIWINGAPYKRVVKKDPVLYNLFKQAKASLKVSK